MQKSNSVSVNDFSNTNIVLVCVHTSRGRGREAGGNEGRGTVEFLTRKTSSENLQ